MEPNDILLWRKRNHFSKVALAKAMNVTRQTVANWERGATRPPVGLRERLALLALGKEEDAAPALIIPDTAAHWPHLKLYVKGPRPGLWTRGPEHPANLIPAAGGKDGTPYPAAVLESDEYNQALLRSRNRNKHVTDRNKK